MAPIPEGTVQIQCAKTSKAQCPTQKKHSDITFYFSLSFSPIYLYIKLAIK